MILTSTTDECCLANPEPVGASGATCSPERRRWAIDPLDEDDAGDDVVLTTRRAICRVALVAAETAGRFQRDGLSYDPMGWMLAPRKLFGGEPALDACLERDACLRGVLVHGLSLGLDMDPVALDALTGDGDAAGRSAADAIVGDVAASTGENGRESSPSFSPVEGGRLFTATIVSRDAAGTVQVFHASMAHRAEEVARRLTDRVGAAVAEAVIVDGFDATDPLVEALVSPAIADILRDLAADPASPLGNGLELHVEQRFRT